MNIAMEQTEEYQDGQLKAKYGDTFIRGNNGVVFLSPALYKPLLCLSHIRNAKARHVHSLTGDFTLYFL